MKVLVVLALVALSSFAQAQSAFNYIGNYRSLSGRWTGLIHIGKGFKPGQFFISVGSVDNDGSENFYNTFQTTCSRGECHYQIYNIYFLASGRIFVTKGLMDGSSVEFERVD